jgi:hypothetical protein
MREQYGMTKITVGGDVVDVSIVLGSGATASGRVIFEGDTPPPNPPSTGQMGVPMNATDTNGVCRSGQAQVAPDWTFSVEGLIGTCSTPTFGQFGRWTVKSVVVNHQDLRNGSITFEPGQHYTDVQIVVTDRRNELNLHVTDEQGRATREYAAIVFSVEKSRWEGPTQMIRTFVPQSAEMISSMQAIATASGRGTLPSQLGKELVSGLIAGDYYAVALDDIEAESARDPAVLERLAAVATRVTMTEGAVDVNLARIRLSELIR